MQDIGGQRKQRRIKLPPQQCTLKTVHSRRNVSCLLVDVSPSGIGVSTPENLLPDTQVILMLGERQIYMSMTWCSPPAKAEGVFTYGFRVSDKRINVQALILSQSQALLDLLVVDDEEAITEVYQSIFSALGHRVDIANSGDAAAALMAEKRFDLVLSDLSMPNGNGLKVVRNARLHGIPVALITAYAPAYQTQIPSDVPVIDKGGIESIEAIPRMVLERCGIPGRI